MGGYGSGCNRRAGKEGWQGLRKVIEGPTGDRRACLEEQSRASLGTINSEGHRPAEGSRPRFRG